MTGCTWVALMSLSLEMLSLCHLPLVDLGQHFPCNLAVITAAGCTAKTEGVFWHEILSATTLSAEESLLFACLLSALTPVTHTGQRHCSYLKKQNCASGTGIKEQYLHCRSIGRQEEVEDIPCDTESLCLSQTQEQISASFSSPACLTSFFLAPLVPSIAHF